MNQEKAVELRRLLIAQGIIPKNVFAYSWSSRTFSMFLSLDEKATLNMIKVLKGDEIVGVLKKSEGGKR